MKKKTDLKQAIFYVICAAVIISKPTTVSASNEQTAVEDTGEQQPSLRQFSCRSSRCSTALEHFGQGRLGIG